MRSVLQSALLTAEPLYDAEAELLQFVGAPGTFMRNRILFVAPFLTVPFIWKSHVSPAAKLNFRSGSFTTTEPLFTI